MEDGEKIVIIFKLQSASGDWAVQAGLLTPLIFSFYLASLKSLGHFRCILSSQWLAVTVNLHDSANFKGIFEGL